MAKERGEAEEGGKGGRRRGRDRGHDRGRDRGRDQKGDDGVTILPLTRTRLTAATEGSDKEGDGGRVIEIIGKGVHMSRKLRKQVENKQIET